MIQVNYKIGHEDVTDPILGFSSGSDYAGGNDIEIEIKNCGTKVIKYYTLYFSAQNAVGDEVADNITGLTVKSVKGTGPLETGKVDKGKIAKGMFYNHSITAAKLLRAEVEYMDGTKDDIDGKDITRIEGGTGCYVATAVYGSYDCPEVWTLRRYRDFTLAETWYGRAFIHTYYAISPTLVKWFGNTNWFKKLWKGKLDRMVSRLNSNGVENTPYDDRIW